MRSLWDAVAAVFGQATVTTPDDAGVVQVRDEDTGHPREGVIQVGLPGFYARAAAGVRGLLLRTKAGGLLFGTETTPPTDAQVGEAGIYVGDSKVRVKPDGEVEIESVAGTTIVVDPVAGAITITGTDATTITSGNGDNITIPQLVPGMMEIDTGAVAGVITIGRNNGGVVLKVARDTDAVNSVPGSPLDLWITAVGAALAIPPPAPGYQAGVVVATTAKTFSG